MSILVNYKEEYNTMNELLDRIGYIKTMIVYLGYDPKEKQSVDAFNEELLDREIQLVEFIAQLEQDDDSAVVMFRTENFGLVTPNRARELYIQLNATLLPTRMQNIQA